MGDTIGMDGCDLRSKGTLSCISFCSPVIPSPDLSSCHRCGLRFPISGTIDRFRTLDSQWRIVLLCYDCLDGVKSTKVCSYCFLGIPELEKGLLGCIACSCRVHRTCIPLHHRNLWPSQLNTDNFICVDCCPIHIFRGEELDKCRSTHAVRRPRKVRRPRTGFRFLLEDLVREEKSISKKEATTEGQARKNTLNRAMVARNSTEVSKTTLGAVHLVKRPSHNNTIPDEELALRLHRSINGSQRISRTFCLKDEARLSVLRKVRGNNCSAGRVVDSNSCGHPVKMEGCSENMSLLEDIETSQSSLNSNLLEAENENLLKKQIRGYNTEGIDGFSLKESDILYMSSDSTSDCSNVGSAALLMNGLLNNTLPSTKLRVGVGEGSSELLRKAIDAPGSDMYTKKYFRKQWGSRRFLVGS